MAIVGMTIAPRAVLSRSVLALLLFAVCAAAAEEAAARREYGASAPDAVKESLAARVSAFYEFFQAGKFRDAEALVTGESRDVYYNITKIRIFGFDIKSMEFAEDFKFARVAVTCKMPVPMMGLKSLDVPISSEWHWRNGDWFMHFGPRRSPDGSIQTPFGPMKGAANTGAASSGGPFPPAGARPTLDSLANMFRADRTQLRMSGSEPGEQSISIENRAAGPLDLKVRGSLPPGVRVVLPERIAAGGSGKVRFVYTPGEEPLQGRHTVELTVRPIEQVLKVSIDF